MKKIILGLLLACGLVSAGAAGTLKIAALINGDIISTEDISNQVNIFMLNSPIPLNAETRKMITHRVMAQTIEQKLKMQAADKEGIVVSEAEIEEQLKTWAKKNNVSLSSLAQHNISRQAVADNVKAELAWIKLIRKKYYQSANITQKEIDETIEEITKDMTIKKFLVSEIFIKKENAGDIQGLVDKLREDSRFDLYAARFSEAPSAANGGNLGWINSGKMLSALEMRLNRMSPGDVSDAILIGNGYYILKLQQVFDPEQHSGFSPNSAEVKTLLENQKMESISKKLLQDIKQRAVIEVKGGF